MLRKIDAKVGERQTSSMCGQRLNRTSFPASLCDKVWTRWAGHPFIRHILIECSGCSKARSEPGAVKARNCRLHLMGSTIICQKVKMRRPGSGSWRTNNCRSCPQLGILCILLKDVLDKTHALNLSIQRACLRAYRALGSSARATAGSCVLSISCLMWSNGPAFMAYTPCFPQINIKWLQG